MKKKLFFIITLVAVFACVFAISVSAATKTTMDGTVREITTYTDAPAKTNFVTSTNDVVVFDDGFVCPSAYIFVDSKSTTAGAWSIGLEKSMNFEFVNGKRGKTYTFANILELDIPQGITTIGAYAAYGTKTLKRLTIPDSVTSVGQSFLEGSTSIEECVFEHNAKSTLDYIYGYSFFRCTSLKAISLPDCMKGIKGGYQFSGCSNLTAVHLPDSLEVMEGGTQNAATFDGCNKMYFVNEPFTYDNIPTKPEVYYFPKNFATIGDGCIFRSCTQLNKYLVFDVNMKKIPNLYTFENNANSTVVFLGVPEKIVTGGWKTTNIIFANPNVKCDADAGLERIGYDGNNAKTWGGKAYFCHVETDANHAYKVAVNTAPTCTQDGVNGTACFCGAASSEATVIKAQHDYGNELSFNAWAWTNDNYFANANYKHVCQDCGEEYIGEEIANSHLFVKEGYSSFENKNGEETTSYDVQFSIKVNQAAMTEYTNQTGNTVRYGTVAGVGNSLETPLSYAEGELTVGSSAVMSEMTGTDYVKLIIKIVKIPVTDKPVTVSCNAFAIVDDKLRYVSDGTVNETAEPKTV